MRRNFLSKKILLHSRFIRFSMQIGMDSFVQLMISITAAFSEMTSNGQPVMVDD